MSETLLRKFGSGIINGLLVAAVLLFFAGCAGKEKISSADVAHQAIEDLRTEIRQAIDDPVRQDEVIALADALADEVSTLRKHVSERKQRVRQLNANYDTPRADFKAFVGQVRQEIQAQHLQVAKQHRAMLAITTPDEWAAISKSHTKAMKAAIKSMQAI